MYNYIVSYKGKVNLESTPGGGINFQFSKTNFNLIIKNDKFQHIKNGKILTVLLCVFRD